jgi:two-component system chemotaxis response regulator CheB
MPLKVLVVDDTAVFRLVVSDALATLPDVEVVGTADNGRTALARIAELKPDLVTLDIEMPVLDGLQVLEALRKDGTDVGVLVLSALTKKGGELTMKAMDLGAFDFVTKPSGGSASRNRQWLVAELGPRLKAFARRRDLRKSMKRHPAGGLVASPSLPAPDPRCAPPMARPARPEMVVIGVSTGGPAALASLLPQLPANLAVPVFIVQHMPPLFSKSLADSLNTKCQIRVKEAEDGELAVAGTAYIAPGGRQMKLVPGTGGGKLIRITDDPSENHSKPSVDYLFRSVSHGFPGKATAVILTGMGNDGTVGLRLIKRHGGTIIAQDESSCVVFGMPKEAIAAGVVDVIAPLRNIAAEILETLKGGPS